MSKENVEIVRRVYEGWSRGDFSQSELFDPDIEFEMVDWPHPAKSRGLEAMRETWLATLAAWEDFRAVPSEVIDRGDNVLVLNSISGRGRGSGADVSALLGHRAGARGGGRAGLAERLPAHGPHLRGALQLECGWPRQRGRAEDSAE
jgi:ketosteroid isomerase-like protein